MNAPAILSIDYDACSKAPPARPARAPRTAQSPRRRNPLDALLGAVHDAHLAARAARH